MTDWNTLSPHRPTGIDDHLYVDRPDSASRMLAERIRAGGGPFAVAGPMGCGKTSEIFAAATMLQQDYVVVMVPLDRMMDMRTISVPEVLRAINSRIFDLAERHLKIQLPDQLKKQIEGAFLVRSSPAHADILRNTLREVRRHSIQQKIVLMLDGLEKVASSVASEILVSLFSYSAEASLVFVVSPNLVSGPQSYEIVNQARVVSIDPVNVWNEDEGFVEGRKFLLEIAKRRLSLNSISNGFADQLDMAAFYSGGVPRVFLQILHDAAGFASLSKRDFPIDVDFGRAIADQADSLFRVLRDGDLESLRLANGTSGVEVQIDRRLRFLTHGLLLHYHVNHQVVARPAPLLLRYL
jgi:hypothetical protein